MALIRTASRADEAFLREMLYLALFVPPGKPAFPREVLDAPMIAHCVDGFGTKDRDTTGFIAEDGEPVGAAWVRLFTSESPGYGYVDDDAPELSIAVVEESRGKGVGTALMERLLEAVPRCSLSVDDRNPAIDLYRRYGFVTVAVDGHSVTMLRE
jgi:[ribosomal protein S18]-alanine N-acetyltransferase